MGVSGCVGDVAARFNTDPGQPETGLSVQNGGALAEDPGAGGQIITDLRGRGSILPKGGVFDQIARGLVASILVKAALFDNGRK